MTCPQISQLISRDKALGLYTEWKLADSFWEIVIQREIFDDIFFEESTYYEAVGLTYQIMEKSEKVYVIDHVVYADSMRRILSCLLLVLVFLDEINWLMSHR